MTKLLSALVAALFALGTLSPAFAAADEKKKDGKAVAEKKAEGKKKSEEKKDEKAKK